MGKIITGYKGFDRGWKCRGFQYEVGKKYEIEGEPKLCERGFHFCTSPLEVFKYYDPTKRFAIVEADEDDVIYDGCSPYAKRKAVARRLTIVRELTFLDLVEIHKKYAMGREPLVDTGETTHLGGCGIDQFGSDVECKGNYSLVGANAAFDFYTENEGEGSVAVAAGTDCAVAATLGIGSAACATGAWSVARSWGSHSFAVTTSRESAAISSKYGAAAVATNNDSAAIGSKCATAMCTGFGSVAVANGKESLAVAAGEHCSASGVLGSWLVLVHRDCGQIIDVKTVKVDGETIKEGVRYELYYGNIREVL